MGANGLNSFNNPAAELIKKAKLKSHKTVKNEGRWRWWRRRRTTKVTHLRFGPHSSRHLHLPIHRRLPSVSGPISSRSAAPKERARKISCSLGSSCAPVHNKLCVSVCMRQIKTEDGKQNTRHAHNSYLPCVRWERCKGTLGRRTATACPCVHSLSTAS